MAIIVKEPESSFTPCPPGAHHAVCVDVVDLGTVETQWGMKPMVRLVWQVEETMPDGRPFFASQRFGASLHEKSTLRKFLESWRGKPLSADDLKGLDLEKLIGVNALLNVVQTSKDGRIFSNIAATRFSHRIHPEYLNLQQRLADVSGVVEESVAGIRVVKGFGAEDLQSERLDAAAIVLPALAAFVVGIGDEAVQWFIPARVGELRDVWLNSVAIGGSIAARGAQERRTTRRRLRRGVAPEPRRHRRPAPARDRESRGPRAGGRVLADASGVLGDDGVRHPDGPPGHGPVRGDGSPRRRVPAGACGRHADGDRVPAGNRTARKRHRTGGGALPARQRAVGPRPRVRLPRDQCPRGTGVQRGLAPLRAPARACDELVPGA